MFGRQRQIMGVTLIPRFIATIGIVGGVDVVQEGLSYGRTRVSLGGFIVRAGRRRPRRGGVWIHRGMLLRHSFGQGWCRLARNWSTGRIDRLIERSVSRRGS